ncbi:MAG: endonuclease/exonuclease/phosphatase family protein [Bacteroidales bacterium]
MRYILYLIASANIVLLIALLFGLFAGQLPPSSFGFLPFFGLFYPLILIANMLFALFWIIKKSWFALIPVSILLFGINNFFDNFQVSLGSDSNEADTGAIKVLTYNVQQFRNGNKVSQPEIQSDILTFINKQKAGIICLQEYQTTGHQIYETLKQTRDELNTGIYYYESYFNPKYDLLSGMVIFSKFQAVNKGKLKIEDSRTFGIYTDLLIYGDTVRVFNIHLASIKLGKEDLGFVSSPGKETQEQLKIKSLAIYQKLNRAFLLRERQVSLLMKMLENTRYPILLCGDFNDTPSSWVYHQLQTKLNDSFVDRGNGISITFAGPIPLLRIDYVLHSGFNTVQYTRHQIARSDHFPVSATLQLTK